MLEEGPVRESLREISNSSWIVGGKIVFSRVPSRPATGTFWSDGTGSFYTITETTELPPDSRPLSPMSRIQHVYDAGDVSSVWMVGEAFCKVKIIDSRIPYATREHVTINGVRSRAISFAIPEVYYHTEFNGRYYIFLSKIHGETLSQAWVRMEEETKQNWVSRMVSIVKELATWQSNTISGVDGGHLSDLFLTPLKSQKDCSPSNLLSCCKQLNMDCSTFMFYHCDLGPGNIIVSKGEIVGIIDWEVAGYVPREWIRTKFCISSGLDLPGDSIEDPTEWRKRVQRHLEREGFPEVAEIWLSWWSLS